MKFSVFGAGSWGTAIAIHLARTGHTVTLVPRRAEQATSLSHLRENVDYLPKVKLEPSIAIEVNKARALEAADVVFLGCPSSALKALAIEINEILNKQQKSTNPVFIVLSKGLDRETLAPPVSNIVPILKDYACGMLSGPNFALEVAQGKPAATTLALKSTQASSIQKALSNEQFRVYLSEDIRGVEYAGCLKNVYAIGAGICDGLQLGDNAKAAYLTRSLYELVKIGTAQGGKKETFYGLSGMGDLTGTCYGPLSRNRSFGQNIAQGQDPETFFAVQKNVVEGYWTIKSFYQFLKNYSFEAPILEALYTIVHQKKSPHKAILNLMGRTLKKE